MRIALWNGCGINNLGDRLLDLVNRRELGRRLPGAHFDSFSPWVSRAAPEGFRPQRLRIDQDGQWSGEGAFDAIVIGGGGLLRGPPFGHPGLQAFYLGAHPERFRDRCPIAWNAVCSAGTGASSSRTEWRNYVRAAMDRIDVHTVRNAATWDFLRGCSEAHRVDVVPDPAVLAFDAPPARPRNSRRLGVAVPRLVFPIEFLLEIAESAGQDSDLVNPDVFETEDYMTTLLAYDEEEYVNSFAGALAEVTGEWKVEICGFGNAYGDPQVARAIAGAVENAELVEFSDPDGTDAFSWISTLDCLVASRLHACVLALAAGTPVVGLDPHDGATKLREFFASLDGAGVNLPLGDFLDGRARLPAAIDSARERQGHLMAMREAQREQAGEHFDTLVERLFPVG